MFKEPAPVSRYLCEHCRGCPASPVKSPGPQYKDFRTSTGQPSSLTLYKFVEILCVHEVSSRIQADAGGMVSPGGLSYIGRSKEILGDIPGAVAIKRIILDEALIRASQK